MRHRPIGLGVQGLANVFYEMKTAFGSEEAREINLKIFESIYFGSLEASMEIARDREVDMLTFKTGINQHDPHNKDFVQDDILQKLNDKLKPIDNEINSNGLQ